MNTKKSTKSYLYSILKPKYNTIWKNEIFHDRIGKRYGNKLRTYRLFKNDFSFEPYLESYNFNRNILTTFRISVHNLEIERGRHQNIPLNDRTCKLCKQGIEDEIHF